MKKASFLSLMIIVLMALTSGCGKITPGETIVLNVGGFPMNGDHPYDQIKIEQFGSDQTYALKSIVLSDLDGSVPISTKISFEQSCTKIVLSLSWGDNYREYYAEVPVVAGVKEYNVMYWLTDRFPHQYGFSDMLAIDVGATVTKQVDFSKTPVVVFRAENARNQNYEVKISNVTGTILFKWGSGIIYASQVPQKTIETAELIAISDVHDPYLYIGMTSIDPLAKASATVTVTKTSRTLTNGLFSKLVSGSRPDLVFGTDIDHGTLCYINPLEKRITKDVDLPDPRPIDMAYSAVDNKLYLISQYLGNITVYDVEQESFTRVQYSKLADGLELAIAPERRRIYVSSTEGIFIIDMDSLQVLAHEKLEVQKMAVDPVHEKLYLATGSYSSKILKYSLSNDQIVLEEQNDNPGGSCTQMLVSPDGEKLIYACNDYNPPGLVVFNTDKLTVSWEYNLKVNKLALQNSTIFAVGSESDYMETVYALDLANYSSVKKFNVPFKNTLVTPNSDGSVLVAFCSDAFAETYALYYYDLP